MSTIGKGEHYRKMEDECFGLPGGGSIVGLVIGLIIILVGLSYLLREMYGIQIAWWPFVVIIFGVLMILGALTGLRRRR